MTDQSIFTNELIAEAETLTTAHGATYKELKSFKERTIDHMIDMLSKFQFAHGIKVEPLSPYFLNVLMQDSSVRTAIESIDDNYEALQGEAIGDIFRNAGSSDAMKPLRAVLGISSMIDIQKIEADGNFVAFDREFKSHFEGMLGRMTKTTELDMAIELAIVEPDENPFALRVFGNLLRQSTRSDVVARVLFAHGIEVEILKAPSLGGTASPSAAVRDLGNG